MRSALVAGVGNVFLGDDGFGVAVARRMLGEGAPAGATVLDAGIRGLDLAFRLLEPVDLLVVADAVRRGGAPGTVYLIEPEMEGLDELARGDGHAMDLPSVFAMVRALGGTMPRVRIVGCEPATIDERMELSPPVDGAVGEAVTLIRELLERELEVEA
jgi:hydrogenase maturation protease